MPGLSILVIEDDELTRGNIAHHLLGHAVDFAKDEGEARRKLAGRKPDICFIDLQLGEDDKCSGLKLIPIAAEKGSYSVVMSSHDSDPHVEKAYSLGCKDFFSKGDVKASVEAVLGRYEQSRRAASAAPFTDAYVTTDPATRSSVTAGLKYAASDLPILILGPSGTGKTTLARVIHEQSGRTGQFVSINCSSYTEELLEVELFGHKKGAFTDAKEERKGKLLLADRGTLFLDEIGAMSVAMQTKLLKAIEEQVFYPLGSDKPETSRFRIVSATLEEPTSLIAAGKLRLDFFERIHGVTLRLPGLVQRTGDILPLLSYFNRDGRKLSFSAEAKERLQRHSWPGNVRELKKLIELLKAGDDGRVTAERVEELLSSRPMLAAQEGGQVMTEEQYRYALAHGLKPMLERIVEAAIRRNLADNEGRKRKVVADLRINNRMLYNTLRRLGARAKDKGNQ